MIGRQKFLRCVLILIGFALLSGQSTKAQVSVTVDDYQRAELLLRPNNKRLVKNMNVIPNWIGEGHLFWYKRETQAGHEYVLVDAATAKKKPLFDHKWLAKILGTKNSDALPLNSLSISAEMHSISFQFEGQEYNCVIDANCAAKPPESFAPELLVSPDHTKAIKTIDGNIYLVDIRSGTEKQLTKDGEEHFGYGIMYGNWKARYAARAKSGHQAPPMGAEWSPSSKYAVVTRLDQRHVKEYPILESAPVDGTYRPKVYMPRIPLTGEKPPTLDWHILDVETGTKTLVKLPYEELLFIHQDMFAIRMFSWNEETGKLYAVAHGDYMKSAHFYEIDIATGAVKSVVSESMSPRTDLNSTSYNPPNVRYVPESNEVIWWSQASGWGHLYLYDVATGKLKNQITKGDWLVRDILHVDTGGRKVFFSGTHREGGSPYDRYIYSVNLDGTDLTLLGDERADRSITSPGNNVLSLDGAQGYDVVSPDGQYIVYNYSRIDQPTKTVVRATTKDAKSVVFEEADTTELYKVGWQHPVELKTKAADGKTDLWSVLYKPFNLDASKSYPIINSQYASPLTAVVPRNFMMAVYGTHGRLSPGTTASLGFAVITVDSRGTAYRNREFMHYSYGNLNTIGLEDHQVVIEDAKRKYDWINLDKVGIYGSSYGGFAALRAMLEYPDFYHVGIANVPVGSFHSMYPDYHWEAFHGIAKYENGTRFYSDPTDRPVNYQNNDMTAQAANLKGKLLILMGEMDENVLPGSTLQTVDALIKADRDFDMIYNPSESHGHRRPFTARKMLGYFVRYLHEQEPPRYHFSTLDY